MRRGGCFSTSTAPDYELRGSLSSEDIDTVNLVMSPDADLANDLETSKSTSGLWLELLSSVASWLEEQEAGQHCKLDMRRRGDLSCYSPQGRGITHARPSRKDSW